MRDNFSEDSRQVFHCLLKLGNDLNKIVHRKKYGDKKQKAVNLRTFISNYNIIQKLTKLLDHPYAINNGVVSTSHILFRYQANYFYLQELYCEEIFIYILQVAKTLNVRRKLI